MAWTDLPHRTEASLSGTGTWTWWTKPRATRVSGSETQVFIGSTDASGGTIVSAIDEATGAASSFTLHQFDVTDDHNNPTVLAQAGKPLVCLYANHNLDRLLRRRRTTENADDTLLADMTWSSEQTIDFGHLIDSYPVTVTVGDTIWTFCRMRHGSTNDDYHAWAFVKSTDWGQTWSAPVKVWESKWHYLAMTLCDDDQTVRVGLCRHPNEGGSPELWYCQINLSTGAITTSDGTALGNLDGTSLPIQMTSMEQAGAVTSGYRQWVYDIGPVDATADPAILSATFATADIEGTGKYHATVLSGGTWTRHDIIRTGAAFWTNYLGGIQFDPDGSVWLARERIGAWFVERYVTTDYTTWAASRHAWEESTPLRNPWPIVGGTSGRRAVMSRLTQFDHWNDWEANLVVLGDEG